MGRRIVLTCDRTLTSEYRHVPLLDFLPCAPSEKVPELLFKFLAPQTPAVEGILLYAPYGLRKVEASLLRNYSNRDVVVAHPDYVESFIDEETKVVGIYEMDPLGLGPLSLAFTAGHFTSFSKKYFLELVNKLNYIRRSKGLRFKIVVGGPGAWYLDVRPQIRNAIKIDHVVIGEVDHIAPGLFREFEEGDPPDVIKITDTPRLEDIPLIVNPSIHGLVEVMRGCGRNCHFCDPTLRVARYIPIENVLEEIRVNTKYEIHNAWVHSEDIFLYRVEDKKNFYPNRDALIELFSSVMSVSGVRHSNPTHGTVAPAAADPLLIHQLSKILRGSPEHLIGIQCGMETGSGSLLARYMPLKAKPFSPEEWPEVVINGTAIFNMNYWFPGFTLLVGLPTETDEDAWDTVRLLHAMESILPEKIGERAHFTVTPLFFVPMGVLRGEEFFDASKLTEAQMCVIYRAWRHILIELNRLPPRLIKLNPFLKLAFNMIAHFGANLVVKVIEKSAKSMGYDVSKALRVDPIKAKVSLPQIPA
ncbi:MAG: radical SAM protein [Nitrososphaerota archaeon]|nr:B12-binding domain-containing radical SAM protein [Aigarchaeota archaeon]MDW8077134.1 radical SAM protein [Nitrososphaerota archaeon]